MPIILTLITMAFAFAIAGAISYWIVLPWANAATKRDQEEIAYWRAQAKIHNDRLYGAQGN